MSHMNEIIPQNNDFLNIYNRSYRLTAAVFLISNVINENEELRTKMKKLSLDLMSMSVNLKDINFYEAKNILKNIEKNSLELMSMIDIASVSGLISEMNGKIVKEEFQFFVVELNRFSNKFENDKNSSVKSIFMEKNYVIEKIINADVVKNTVNNKNGANKTYDGNGHKRKDLRRNMILDFIKGHNDVSIKDIVPNITGCSEKTVQRELIMLINSGQIKKTGERRWSRYSLI